MSFAYALKGKNNALLFNQSGTPLEEEITTFDTFENI